MKFKKLPSLALIPLITASSFAVSQEAADTKIEEVLVTGSYLKSSAKDGASPIVVVDRDNIDQMGAMSISDITRNMTANSGAENVPDSFTSGSTQGTSNVNLRGLGLGSTLVLVNGRRNTLAAAVANDGSSFVDTSMIPAIAIERVEVLKEGAAAVYGSDAIAGVVNYITRSDFEGTEIGVFQQSTTSDSQTDTQISFLQGWADERTNVVVAAQYMDRSNLSGADRPTLIENANSGWAIPFSYSVHLPLNLVPMPVPILRLKMLPMLAVSKMVGSLYRKQVANDVALNTGQDSISSMKRSAHTFSAACSMISTTVWNSMLKPCGLMLRFWITPSLPAILHYPT